MTHRHFRPELVLYGQYPKILQKTSVDQRIGGTSAHPISYQRVGIYPCMDKWPTYDQLDHKCNKL